MTRKLLPALLALVVLGPAARAQSVTTLHVGGPPADRLDLVLVAESYAEDAGERFLGHARRVVAALRAKEPFRSYLPLVNVHAVFAPGTRFGTRFTGGRMIEADQAAIQQAALAAPDVDQVLVLVDDKRHAGSAYGTTALLSTGSSTLEDVALHELGHTIARLADEYEDEPGTTPRGEDLPPERLAELFADNRNVSPWRERDRLPWRAWVEPDTKIPASLFTRGVSAFEGAAYRSHGMYRPKRRCGMRDNASEFCEPCREALVVEIVRRAAPSTVSVDEGGAARVVRVRSALPLDGLRVTQSRQGERLVMEVTDGTAWVRGDRAALTQRFEVVVGDAGFVVAVEAAPPPHAPEPDGAGFVGALDGTSEP